MQTAPTTHKTVIQTRPQHLRHLWEISSRNNLISTLRACSKKKNPRTLSNFEHRDACDNKVPWDASAACLHQPSTRTTSRIPPERKSLSHKEGSRATAGETSAQSVASRESPHWWRECSPKWDALMLEIPFSKGTHIGTSNITSLLCSVPAKKSGTIRGQVVTCACQGARGNNVRISKNC